MRYRKKWSIDVLCLSLLAATVAGCGSGGGGESRTSGPTVLEVTLLSRDADDGYVRVDDDSPWTLTPEVSAGIAVGNMFGELGHMNGLVRFDLSALADKRIRSARLVLTQNVHGGDPWLLPGGLHVESVDMGEGLDASDFTDWGVLAGAEPPPVVAIHETPLSDGQSVEWIVTEAVLADVASDLHADFRLRFPGATEDYDGTYVRFYDAGSSPVGRPKLIIEYEE